MEIDWERRDLEDQTARDADERADIKDRVDHLLALMHEPGFDNDGAPQSLVEGLDFAIEALQTRIHNHAVMLEDQDEIAAELASAAADLYQWAWFGEIKNRDMGRLRAAIVAAGYDPDLHEPTLEQGLDPRMLLSGMTLERAAWLMRRYGKGLWNPEWCEEAAEALERAERSLPGSNAPAPGGDTTDENPPW